MAEKQCNLLKNGGGMSNYSTTAIVVGKDTDGKPVYEKTYTGTLSTSNTYIVTSEIDSDHNEIISYSGYAKNSAGAQFCIPYVNITNDRTISLVLSTSGLRFDIYGAGASIWHNQPFRLTVRYK